MNFKNDQENVAQKRDKKDGFNKEPFNIDFDFLKARN